MESVQLNVVCNGTEVKPIFVPFCTWDKFGDIGNSDAKSFRLLDELVSFFTKVNMYSSPKVQVLDTKEYQDFLQMFTVRTNLTNV